MKIKKAICLTLVSSMLFSMPVFASEEDADTLGKEVVVSIQNENANTILFEELSAQEQIISNDDFRPLDSFADRFNVQCLTDEIMAAESGGDKYEPNNGVASATTGCANRRVTATIHEAADVDWYKLEVVNTEDPYSFVLMNIPTDCDYDLLLINSDLNSGYSNFQDGNVTEDFYININEPGTYYVAVESHSGFSDSPYTLYFGSAYHGGDTGWRDPGLSFNFGNVPRSSNFSYVPSQYYDLSNDTSIPVASVMTDLMITADGNTTEWAGLYKCIKEPSGYGMEQLGNIPTFDVPQMAYYVKQRWEIFGRIQYSRSFVWTPRIFIGYKYVVTPQTMSYVN